MRLFSPHSTNIYKTLGIKRQERDGWDPSLSWNTAWAMNAVWYVKGTGCKEQVHSSSFRSGASWETPYEMLSTEFWDRSGIALWFVNMWRWTPYLTLTPWVTSGQLLICSMLQAPPVSSEGQKSANFLPLQRVLNALISLKPSDLYLAHN